MEVPLGQGLSMQNRTFYLLFISYVFSLMNYFYKLEISDIHRHHNPVIPGGVGGF